MLFLAKMPVGKNVMEKIGTNKKASVLPKTCNPYTGDKKTYLRYSNPGDQQRRDVKS